MKSICVAALLGLLLLPKAAFAQAPPEVTPNFSVTPTKTVTPWIYQMAVGAVVVAALILIFLVVSYLRFSPKFFGKEAPAAAVPPGTRPPLLQRAPRPAPAMATAAARPAATAGPGTARAPAPAQGAGTATAVAERPAEVAAPEAPAPAPEPAEPPPPAPAPAQAPQAAQAPPAPAPAAPAQATPAPAATHAESALDQETFDRVLKEQLDKGMDRRVAEGRARAAAVVAARKKAQG